MLSGVYVVNFLLSGVYRRAVVMNYDKEAAMVSFVDTGDLTVTALDRLRVITDSLVSMEPLVDLFVFDSDCKLLLPC